MGYFFDYIKVVYRCKSMNYKGNFMRTLEQFFILLDQK